MSGFAYKRFLTIDLKHAFYKSGFTKDISIAPTLETQQLMINNRMLYRNTPTGARVVYKATSTTDPTPVIAPDTCTLTFALMLTNAAEFMNFSDLDSLTDTFSAGKLLHFYNDVLTSNHVEYELLEGLLPWRFTYDFTMASPTAVKLRIKKGTTTVFTSANNLTADTNGLYHETVDLTAFGPGKYTFEQLNSGTATVTKYFYVDNNLAGKGIFGIVDITYDTTAISFTSFVALTATNAFAVQFAIRSSKWKFYIINKSPLQRNFATPGNFTITDTDNYPLTGTPYATSAYTFTTAVAGPPINGFESIVIASNQTIPFFETAKKNFVLKENATTLIDDLPNPKISSISADPTDISITKIFVYV